MDPFKRYVTVNLVHSFVFIGIKTLPRYIQNILDCHKPYGSNRVSSNRKGLLLLLSSNRKGLLFTFGSILLLSYGYYLCIIIIIVVVVVIIIVIIHHAICFPVDIDRYLKESKQTNKYIRSDKGLTLQTSAFESLYGGQFILSTQLIKPIYFLII